MPIWPLTLYAFAVIALTGAIIAASHFLGERHHGRATDVPYESGVPPTGTSRLRLSVRFYQVAMFFLIFDLEAAFIAAWAIAFRSVGWAGYAEFVVFVVVLLAALAYLWREGALDWGGD